MREKRRKIVDGENGMNATAGVTEAPRIVTSVTNVSRKVTGTEGDFTTSLSVPGMHDADRLRLAIVRDGSFTSSYMLMDFQGIDCSAT